MLVDLVHGLDGLGKDFGGGLAVLLLPPAAAAAAITDDLADEAILGG